MLGLHLFMIFITVILVMTGFNILPLSMSRVPLDIRDDDDYLRGLAWQERSEGDDLLDRNALANAQQAERTVYGQRYELFFEKPNGNVFTKENLRSMQEAENKFFEHVEYQSSYCMRGGAGGPCIKPSSVLRYFDGTYAYLDSVFNDPNFDNIVNVLYKAENTDETSQELQAFLGRDAVISNSEATSEITYSTLFLGLPLNGYANDSQEEEKQRDKIEEFLLGDFNDYSEKYYDNGVEGMKFYYFNELVVIVAIGKQVIMDMLLAVASLVFIVVFMCIQTGSLWVSLWAIFSILCCFFTTNLLYRLVLDYRYLGVFHVLSIFIVLGIGADDVFVMYDTWKESSHKTYRSLAHRMSDVYRKACMAMLYTSATTAAAFIVGAFSPFLGIYTFGVFSGILVIVNYLSVILFFPTVIITYHLYWQRFKCCCCCPRAPVEDVHGSQPPPKKNFVVRFLGGRYFKVLTHPVAKWVILVAYLIFFGVFLGFCTQLEVDEEQVGAAESVCMSPSPSPSHMYRQM